MDQLSSGFTHSVKKNIVKDKDENLVFLSETAWILNTAIQQNPKIEFHTTSEFKI